MAESGGLWGIVVLIAVMMFALYLFFEVLGFTPKSA